MRLTAQIDIAAPQEVIWERLNDPERQLEFMAGMTRWESQTGTPDRGLGARYKILMRVGSAEVGSLIEIVESVEHRDLAWSSITGLDQRGRWRLRQRSWGRTHVELRLSYGVAGAGIFGAIAERVGSRQVQRHLNTTLLQLKRQVESEQLAADRARRRATLA